MESQTLGKVKMTPRGEYREEATYVPLDIVSYGGGSYCVLKNVTGVTPTGDDVNYQLLAESGADGKSPQISENKTWLVWDAEAGEYVDTGVSAAGEIPEVDDTLTQPGQPADAAKVGEELRSLSEEMLTEESDPTVPSWAKAAQKPSYTASEVGADPSGTAASQVSAHNTGTDTHSDIRLSIQGLTDRLNALADSDDNTLDQLSEIVAYIKSNRDLISSITTDKVSVADIVDNLTTNVANKPLSAAQGVALKALIDTITVPEKLPNPYALTFSGAVTGTYDGSAPLEVEIPSGGGGLTVTNTAAVGQTVKITAVDENGQPTEWEAVDFSSGGDAEKRVRHIATVSVTVGTTSYEVTVDSNGDALNLESVYILTEKFWGNGGSYVQVKINEKEVTRAYGASGSPQALALEKMGELQKFTNIPKPSDVGISFGDYYNGKSAVTSVGFWSVGSTVDTTIEIYGVDA